MVAARGGAMAERLLEVKGLKTYFFTDEGVVRAVDGIDFHIHRGETLGIVGESGSGKSVTALSIMRLIPTPPGRIVAGTITYNGRNLVELPPAQMRKIRGKEISRSEEHTSELQSRLHLVCRLLLEKKKNKKQPHTRPHLECRVLVTPKRAPYRRTPGPRSAAPRHSDASPSRAGVHPRRDDERRRSI